jgi:hypothetical protein
MSRRSPFASGFFLREERRQGFICGARINSSRKIGLGPRPAAFGIAPDHVGTRPPPYPHDDRSQAAPLRCRSAVDNFPYPETSS